MSIALISFSIAAIFSLVLTPLVGRPLRRFGAVDAPSERKVHARPTPRCGGVAIFLAFILTLALSSFFMEEISRKFLTQRQTSFFLFGAIVVFGVGLIDDFRRVGPKLKLLFQIISASIAFWGGLRIEVFSLLGLSIDFGALSYFVTLFWFVLLINAINLIDGLDGLAAGIVFFTSVVLTTLSTLRGDYPLAVLFSALTGATLGFLRYNFNPATIFMGDGGSYFLGYAIAGLSIMGSVKSDLSATILIPIVSLGLPIFDTLFSTVRRFFLGKKLFMPDKEHLHHRLISRGLTARKAVLFMYGISILLCVFSILLVFVRNRGVGIFLILVTVMSMVFVRKLGYVDYFTSEKIIGWFRDIKDETGLSQDRRGFLDLQIKLSQSRNLQELWQHVCEILDMLKFDFAEMYLKDTCHFKLTKSGSRETRQWEINTSCSESHEDFLKTPCEWKWSRNGFNKNEYLYHDSLLKMEVPLFGRNGTPNVHIGDLWLVKDLSGMALSRHTLKRVEQLRRTMMETLKKLEVTAGGTEQ